MSSAHLPQKDAPTYSEVLSHLRERCIPVRQLHGRGHVAVTLAAGRIAALAFSMSGPNLLWSHPDLGDTNNLEQAPQTLVGGIGGDRLWFSPELRYHWQGKPDWQGLSNYQVPAQTDPGRYVFLNEGPQVVALATKGELPAQGSAERMAFSLERRVRMIDPPLPWDHALMRGVDYVGIETTHALTLAEDIKTGEIDLWHLLQMPVGTTLIVPLRAGHESEPLSYGMPGGWQVLPDRVVWRFEGKANAKLGLAAAALTGRCAVVRKLRPDRWCLIVRQFPSDPAMRYGDHPYGVARYDQVFQAWDGAGFGEMEYHSPVLNAQHGPRSVHDEDQLWAFGGTFHEVAALAELLLEIDIRPSIREQSHAG